ncbi:2-oxoglutarate and iron-dependent oxygenase domain-containing protein [Fastidiosibacter lacustris]|uniref:2-oxoglutarate and iron-dependent oxygenase domain-containing protein n=1 Tax=Fastidiosibacter lacustris TaxID=2056695 RepID=UPI000E34D36C|nr:2-oxoglutarate and iron-dependent oxygenase domain-containing protein [Fastidiosibacter lacustris]
MNKIPVIELSEVRLGSQQAINNAVIEIDKACKEIGFFVITGHGIDKKIIQRAYEGLTDFFNMDFKRKTACKLTSGLITNYTSY